MDVPADLRGVLTPVAELLPRLDHQIALLDAALAGDAAHDAAATRLMTVPGVGPIVALTFQATLDTPDRFGGDAGRASAFVGVVPTERSSGERQQRGRITKAGSPELRAVLIQASWCIWRSRARPLQALRTWAQALAARRGRRIAIVALARRLVRILFAIWRDGTTFDDQRRTSRPLCRATTE
jgi:transposase